MVERDDYFRRREDYVKKSKKLEIVTYSTSGVIIAGSVVGHYIFGIPPSVTLGAILIGISTALGGLEMRLGRNHYIETEDKMIKFKDGANNRSGEPRG